MLNYPQLPSPIPPTRSLDLGVANFGHQLGEMYNGGALLRSISGSTDADKPMIIELAVAAMEELIRLAETREPLWIQSSENSAEILSEEEYARTFPRGVGPMSLGLKSEASRESAVVIMNHINLVEILMDVVGIVLYSLDYAIIYFGVQLLINDKCRNDFRTNGQVFSLG